MRRRALVIAVRCTAALVVGLAAWTLIVLLSVRDDLTRARSSLEQARDSDAVEDTVTLLAAAQADLQTPVDRLNQPGPRLAAAVPLLGRSVSSVTRTAQATLAVTRGARQVLLAATTGPPLLDGGRLDPSRLAEVEQQLRDAADASRLPVRALLAQDTGLVPGTVGDAVLAAQDELDGVPEDLSRAADGLRGLRQVLGGTRPQSVLVVLENNAELRGTGGIVTVFAEATARDGRLEVAAFQDVEDVADLAATARRVPAPPDYRRLYGRYLADTTLWKNTNMDPDVATSSAVLAEVAQVSLGRRPDAVLWLDVPTIAAVLRATGPVRLTDGSELSADNAVTQLLSTAYRDAPATPDGQARRRESLRGAADAVLGDLLGAGETQPSPVTLGRELVQAGRGRHLALWSADPAVQRDLASGGLDGAVRADGGDLSSFAVHNLGGGDADGNKLDFYARRQVSVDVVLGLHNAVVSQRVVLRNTAPTSGLPVYVSGRATPGVSNNLVELALPAGAELLGFSREGRALAVAPRPRGDHTVVQDVAALAPGTSATWLLRYRMHVEGGSYRLALVPQPLAVDAELAVTVRAADGAELETRDLEPAPDGALARSGPYVTGSVLQVQARRPGLLERTGSAVRRFWREPVSLG